MLLFLLLSVSVYTYTFVDCGVEFYDFLFNYFATQTICSIYTWFATLPSALTPRRRYRVPAKSLLTRAIKITCNKLHYGGVDTDVEFKLFVVSNAVSLFISFTISMLLLSLFMLVVVVVEWFVPCTEQWWGIITCWVMAPWIQYSNQHDNPTGKIKSFSPINDCTDYFFLELILMCLFTCLCLDEEILFLRVAV